jgi:subtilisin-like proprotein convertase family protein/Ca2+-binding RTX toxin-like protein
MLAGQVFDDLDGDGSHDSSEPGIDGWIVRVFSRDGTQIAESTSASLDGTGDGIDPFTESGLYSFADLAPGSYFVSVGIPAGFSSTLPDAACQAFLSPERENGPSPIPDLGRTVSRIEVAEDLTIADLNVTLDITHTFDGDLVASLLSPAGTRVQILNRNGGAGSDFIGTVLDDEATRTVAGGQAPFTGRFRPAESLSAFDGESAQGTWTLTIRDRAGADEGTLNLWSLCIGEAAPPQVETGATLRLTLSDGESRQQDFGSFRPGQIEGQVFFDRDGDGQRDPDEPGRSGTRVQLLDTDGEVVDTVITRTENRDNDPAIDPSTEQGLYSFQITRAGIYTVVEAPPAGFVVSFPGRSTEGRHCNEFDDYSTGSVNHTDTVLESPKPNLDNAVGSAAASSAAGGALAGLETAQPLLPDLIVDTRRGLDDWCLDGATLRFAQATPNVGAGPMELRGGEDQGDGTQIVLQRIYTSDGGFVTPDREAGRFSFHPSHGHLHFNDYAQYNLRELLPDADGDGVPDVGDIVAGGNKTSFCLVDIAVFNSTLPGFDPDGSDFGCNDVQRISVGWEDIYDIYTEGQEIDIADVAPGDYWLEAVVDPENHFVEEDETNNTGMVRVTISGSLRSDGYTIRLRSGETSVGNDFGNARTVPLDRLDRGRENDSVAQPHDLGTVETLSRHLTLHGDDEDFLRIAAARDGILTVRVDPGFDSGDFSIELLEPSGTPYAQDDDSSFRSDRLDVPVVAGQALVLHIFPRMVGEAAGRYDLNLLNRVQLTPAGDLTIVGTDAADRVTIGRDIFVADRAGEGTVYSTEDLMAVRDFCPPGTPVCPVHTGMVVVRSLFVHGLAGDDLIRVLPQVTIPAVLLGDAGRDTLVGGGADDRIDGGAHMDHILGGAGNDVLVGGSGADVVFGQDGDDAISGRGGNDTLAGGPGSDRVIGGSGADLLSGGPGLDLLNGQKGIDLFYVELLLGELGPLDLVPGERVNRLGDPTPALLDQILGELDGTLIPIIRGDYS